MDYYRRVVGNYGNINNVNRGAVVLGSSNARVNYNNSVVRPSYMVQQQQPVVYAKPQVAPLTTRGANISQAYIDNHVREYPRPCNLCTQGGNNHHHHQHLASVAPSQDYRSFSVKYNPTPSVVNQSMDPNFEMLKKLEAQQLQIQQQQDQLSLQQRETQNMMDSLRESLKASHQNNNIYQQQLIQQYPQNEVSQMVRNDDNDVIADHIDMKSRFGVSTRKVNNNRDVFA